MPSMLTANYDALGNQIFDPNDAGRLDANQKQGLTGILPTAVNSRVMCVMGHSFISRQWGRDRIITMSAPQSISVISNAGPLVQALNKLGWPVKIPMPYVFSQSGGKIFNVLPDVTYPAYLLYDGSILPDLTSCITKLLTFPSIGLPLPGSVYFACGINDAHDFTDGVSLFIRIKTQVDRLLTAGIPLIVLELMTPVTGPGGLSSYDAIAQAANLRLLGYYGNNARVILFNPYWYVLDQAKFGASDFPSFFPAWTFDGTHWSLIGSLAVGYNQLADILVKYYPFNSPIDWLTPHLYDTFNAVVSPYGNRYVNAWFSGVGGTKIPGSGAITGNAPDSWSITHSGAGTGTCAISIETVAITFPNGVATGQSETRLVLTLDSTASAVADIWWLSQLPGNRGPAATWPEQGFYQAMDYEVVAGSNKLEEVAFKGLNVLDGAPSYNNVSANLAGAQPAYYPATAVRGVVRTPDQALSYTAAFRIDCRIQMTVDVGGSAVVKIARPTCRSCVPGDILHNGAIVT